MIESASAIEIWRQTTEMDFAKGTEDGVMVTGSGVDGEVRLEPLGSGNWKELKPSDNPQERGYFGIASAHKSGNVVLFGGNGQNETGHYGQLNDTWVFNYTLNNWEKKDPDLRPSARNHPAMASIYGTDEILLFGGSIYPDDLNDTWVYDVGENKWINQSPEISPVARDLSAMAPVYGTNKVVLYGGNAGGLQLSDTWVYDLNDNTWTEKKPTSDPHKVNSHKLASIYGTDKVLCYGGVGLERETWIYDLSDNIWEQKTPTKSPSERRDFGMAPIDGADMVMLYGGYSLSGYSYKKDTWIYDFNRNHWALKDPENSPGGKEDLGLAPIYGTNIVLLFGGGKRSNSDDVWIFEGNPTGQFISHAYDTEANSSFHKLSWRATIPSGTNIKFQLRSTPNGSDIYDKPFVGPDGKDISFYTQLDTEIWEGHLGHRWIQYKIYFFSNDINETPIVKEVSIEYNNLPTTVLTSPKDGRITNNNKPTFKWRLEERDAPDIQTGFQVLIDDNSDFLNIDYDSKEQSGGEQKWMFPDGTNYKKIKDGTWYWKVRSKDYDGDWSPYSDSRKMIIDTKPPISIVNLEIKNGFCAGFNEVNGTVNDQEIGSGVDKVEISIKRLLDNYYWNGDGWTKSESWIIVNGNNEWSYNTEKLSWMSRVNYSIRCRATDYANNIEAPVLNYNFTIDQDPPNAIIEFPMNGSFLRNLEIIRGQSSDLNGSGIASTEICIKRFDDGYFWNGSNWSSYEFWFNATGKTTWNLDLDNITLDSGSKYIIQAKASDLIGNNETPNLGNWFVYDIEPPEIQSVIINNGSKYTNFRRINLEIQATDQESKIDEIAYKIEDKNMTNWEIFNGILEIEFSYKEDEGEKNFTLYIKDVVGNIAHYNDTVIFDTTPPYIESMLINNGLTYTNSRLVTIEIIAYDNLSGLSEMSFSNDGINWTAWEEYSKIKEYKLSTGYGEKRVYLRIMDRAGNIGKPISQEILFNSTKPIQEKKEDDDKDQSQVNIILYVIPVIIFFIIIILIIFISIKRRTEMKKHAKPSRTKRKTNRKAKTEEHPTGRIQMRESDDNTNNEKGNK